MANRSVVGFSGNITRPSKTRSLVELITNEAGAAHRLAPTVFDTEDLGPSFAAARRANDLDPAAQALLTAFLTADLVVVASPTYKGSYTGLFKHFFDLIDPAALRGKPVVIAATGGGERHSLVVDHQYRPLFGLFEALSLPTAIYALDRDFADGQIAAPHIKDRIARVVLEAGPLLRNADPVAGRSAS